jgi:hypothetical protein
LAAEPATQLVTQLVTQLANNEGGGAPAASEDRYERAIARFDAANAEDPNQETAQGCSRPKELVYAERMSAMLARLAPDASEVLRLAARCQHIRRWTITRTDTRGDRLSAMAQAIEQVPCAGRRRHSA